MTVHSFGTQYNTEQFR